MFSAVSLPTEPISSNPLLAGSRIIGGEVTTIEERPYQISLEYGSRHRCGGSILNANTILTAAHCTNGYDFSNLTVLVILIPFSSGCQLSTFMFVLERPMLEAVVKDKESFQLLNI